MNTPTPNQIKQTRLSAGLSMQQLAELMGCTRMTVHNWEKGNHPMKPRDYEYMVLKLTKQI